VNDTGNVSYSDHEPQKRGIAGTDRYDFDHDSFTFRFKAVLFSFRKSATRLYQEAENLPSTFNYGWDYPHN